MSAPNARVLRSGHIETVPARNLVPGDVVFIEAGDSIPADMRLLKVPTLWRKPPLRRIGTIGKDASKSFDTEVSIGDRLNMAYMVYYCNLWQGKRYSGKHRYKYGDRQNSRRFPDL